MLDDALVTFMPFGTAPLNLANLAAGAVVPAPVIFDTLGLGVGQAPQGIIGLPGSVFGQDSGVNMRKMFIQAIVGVAFTTATAATLSMQFLGAVDTGAAGNYQPGAFQVFDAVDLIPAASLGAGQPIRMDWPVAAPGAPKPRFFKVQFVVAPAATGIFTAGTIADITVTPGRADISSLKQANSNFSGQ